MPVYHYTNRQRPTADMSLPGFTQVINDANFTFSQFGRYINAVYTGSSSSTSYANNCIAYKAATTGAKTVTMKMQFNKQVPAGGWAGIVIKNSTSFAMTGMYAIAYPGYGWRWISWADLTSYTGSWGDIAMSAQINTPYWVRLVDNGTTTITSQYSTNGTTFTSFNSIARSTAGNCGHVGIMQTNPSLQAGGKTNWTVLDFTVT